MDRRTIEAQELEEKTQDPQFWSDPKAAEATMKKVREVKGWLNGYKQAEDAYNDLAVLFDFAKEGEASEEEVDEQYERRPQEGKPVARVLLSGESE